MIEQKIIRHFYTYDSNINTENLDLLLDEGYIIKSITSSMTEETQWSKTRCSEIILLERTIKEKKKVSKL
jgi:hypothetical protein